MNYYDDGYNNVKPNSALRDDAAVREQVRQILEAKTAALAKAEALVKEALEALVAVPLYRLEDPLYSRVVDAVSRANSQIAGDKRFINEHTETYVGNQAASRLGAVIKDQLDRSV